MYFYVVCDERKIVGCGAIVPYWDKEDESNLFTIFVLPECQGKGIGRNIVETLEHVIPLQTPEMHWNLTKQRRLEMG